MHEDEHGDPLEDPVGALPRRSVGWLLLDLLAFHLALRLSIEGLMSWSPWWRESLLNRPPQFPFEIRAVVVSMGVCSLLVLPLLRRNSEGLTWSDLGLRMGSSARMWRDGAVVFAMVMGLLGASALLVPSTTLSIWEIMGVRSSTDLFVFVVVVAPVFAALSEEILYRGVIQPTLERVNRGWGAIATCILFASAHLYQGWVAVLCFSLPVAAMLTSIRRRSSSLSALMVVHFAVDAVLFVVLYTIVEHPESRIPLSAGLLVGSVATLAVLRSDARALLRETWSWVDLRRTGGTRRHLPWVLGFVLGSAALPLIVGGPALPLPLPVIAIALAAVVLLQAIRRRR